MKLPTTVAMGGMPARGGSRPRGGCGDDDDDESGNGSGAASTVNVYSSLPLQGGQRLQTTAMVDGIKLALDQVGGKVGDITVKYTSLDDSTAQAGNWTPEATGANARRVAGDDKAIAYIGEFNSGASAVSIPILNEVPIAQISPSNTAVGLTSDEPGPTRASPTSTTRAARGTTCASSRRTRSRAPHSPR